MRVVKTSLSVWIGVLCLWTLSGCSKEPAAAQKAVEPPKAAVKAEAPAPVPAERPAKPPLLGRGMALTNAPAETAYREKLRQAGERYQKSGLEIEKARAALTARRNELQKSDERYRRLTTEIATLRSNLVAKETELGNLFPKDEQFTRMTAEIAKLEQERETQKTNLFSIIREHKDELRKE